MGQSRGGHEISDHDDEPPTKTRRISRACMQCRIRKQRCDGPQANPLLPCRRCVQLGATCSFTTTAPESENDNSTLVNTVHKVTKVQGILQHHQKRIDELESEIRALRGKDVLCSRLNDTDPSESCTSSPCVATPAISVQLPEDSSEERIENISIASSADPLITTRRTRNESGLFTNPIPSPRSASNEFTMDAVDLDTPMSTLRNLKSLSSQASQSQSMAYDPIHPVFTRKDFQIFQQDPIIQGIMTTEETQQAFDIYFEYCHPHAPFLTTEAKNLAESIRQASPLLFLSICTVGARFWQSGNRNRQGLHEGYQNLVALLDSAVGRLLLQPSLSDVNLDNIRALQLYIQWMPFEEIGDGTYQTRYNDISALSVLGLAIRYAVILGLDRTAVSPFTGINATSPTREDFARLRVWINLLTCECHLMLAAGLPASLDPAPFAKIARDFSSHTDGLQLDDSKVAAVCELVNIAKDAARESGDPSVRTLDAPTLKRINAKLDSWDMFWTPALSNDVFHNQIPFTSYRWYRLAINSAGLGTILSQSKTLKEPMQIFQLQALENSLLAAAQTIFALSNETNKKPWPNQSQDLTSFPPGSFTIDEDAIRRFRFAVDSTWVTHSFAAVFLVLCYTRGTIDDKLQIVHLAFDKSHLTIAPASPRPGSLLFRLISLASQIFDSLCRTAVAHPAAEYRTIINNLFSVILKSAQEDLSAQVSEDMSMGGLFEMMVDAGFYWQGGLFRDESIDFAGL